MNINIMRLIVGGMDKSKNVFLPTFKVAVAISIVPICFILINDLLSQESWIYYISTCLVIMISAMYIIFPFASDYFKLSAYVKHLSFDRIVQPPKLGSSIAVIELSESLDLLRKSWKKRQRELVEKISESNLLLQAIPEIMFIIKENLVVYKVNNAAEHVFGENLVGNNFRDIIENKVLLGAISLVLHEHQSKKIDLFLPHPIEKDYQVLIAPYEAKETGQSNVIIMMHDVTELKRTEQMLADFIANASHEIRTPLTSIIGIIETLNKDGWDDVEARKLFVPMIAEQAYCMKNLINDLLSLSSIERKVYTYPTETINIIHIVDLVIKQLEWEAMKDNITIKKKLTKNVPTTIGDSHELSQVVYNLLLNAIRYGGPDKRVNVEVGMMDTPPKNITISHKHNGVIYVSVIDQGNGITKEHLGRLTERFYRVEKSRSRKLGGVGLGLSIVKQSLLRHKGFLDITSEVGVGSKFTIYLPIIGENENH